MRPLARQAGALVTLLALAAGGCGGDDAQNQPEAQPVPDASVFQEGNFDRLPRYPGAASVSEPEVERDVVSQSFTSAAATPRQVMDFFTDQLAAAGWTAIDEPGRVGAERTLRGIWEKAGQRLVVSVTRFRGGQDPGDEWTTQYSLSLGPSGTAVTRGILPGTSGSPGNQQR